MIYLVRHGQTAFNAEGRLQGGLDSPLTPLGIEQGKRIGRALADVVPKDSRIIVSPLGRAQHTARLIRETGGFSAEIETDERIAELQLGEWDGKLKLDIEQSSPDFDAGRRRWSWYFEAPGGTTFEGISARISSWLDDARQFDAPTIVVSHGIASRVLRGLFLGLSREEALMQDIPQDACFHLSDGTMRRIDCP